MTISSASATALAPRPTAEAPAPAPAGRPAIDPDAFRIANVLVVEDNPGDVELAMLGFQAYGLIADFHVAQDGARALAFLRDVVAGNQDWRPDLILLDLNLPKVDGHEVLQYIKSQEALAAIPVVVLTSSSAIPDYVRASSLGADAYLNKPMTLRELLEMMKHIVPLLDGRA